MKRTIGTLLVLSALTLGVPQSPLAADTACSKEAGSAWFLGVVHDDARRFDFQADVDNLERYLSGLRDRYCIPDENAEILAFDDGYTRSGKTYDEASEGNVKARLATFGAAASDAPSATLFFFLSSHGIFYPGRFCTNGFRPLGSLSSLAAGPEEDGLLYDCELGDALSDNFDDDVRQVVLVDCSFCGGFSDSLTAASGTLPDGSVPTSSRVPGPGRIVMTGCAITTECFGADGGAAWWTHLNATFSIEACDGWTAPAFPTVQGLDLPVRTRPADGTCSVSEWFFASVDSAYRGLDVISIQEQFRIKYGFDSLAEDVPVL